MRKVSFRHLCRDAAAVIIQWRYVPPYDFYNHPSPNEEAANELLRAEYNYKAIEDSTGRLIGYFCLGPDARVPGWNYDNNALDLGMGLDPALIGQGLYNLPARDSGRFEKPEDEASHPCHGS